LPPQSLQSQAGLAVAVKAKAVTARKAMMNFFIFGFSVEVSFQFSSVKVDGSRRRVSPQARGGGTGGREVRPEHVSSDTRAPCELPGAKMAGGCPAGTMTAGAAGTWQESGGQGQAVAQQEGSVSQQEEAHSATGTGFTKAAARGAAAKEASRAMTATAFI
jgi:hypothetical protein